jgi:ribosomal protein S18 acetylase RimI-like enzyme
LTASNKVTIRKATSGDNVLLSTLGAETFADAFGAEEAADDLQIHLRTSFSPEIQAAELADESTLFLIAEIDRCAVAYACLREGMPGTPISGSRALEVVRLYARNEWTGRRIGASLMRACLDEAASRHCDFIWLGVWEHNERAIRFYRHWGFDQRGTHPFRVGNDIQTDFLMVRAVDRGRP